jgi:predicted dehydrogenase/acetyltransferase-like isoleucine patch superfamily enzyme
MSLVQPSFAQTQSHPPKVGVIGCGYWGRNLVRNFAELGALAAVSDSQKERQNEFAARCGVAGLDVAEMLRAKDIVAIVIAAPAAQHGSLAMRALAAGKHVFVEKPLALDVAEAERVLQHAEQADRLVMVGHLLQYHPAFLKLKELVAQGELGRIQYIYSNRLNLGKFRREENVFWSFAPHDISMILSLAGGLPERVHAIGHCYLHKRIADVTTTHLDFANGIQAHVFVSWLHPFKEQKLVVVGDGGMAVFDDGQPWDRKLLLYRHKVAWRDGLPEPRCADAIPLPLNAAEPLQLECRHFLDCVRDGCQPRTGAREGLAVLRVLDAAERAVMMASPVTLETAGPTPGPYFAHESSCIDPGCTIGEGTKIWHFSHVLSGSTIGRRCIIGQNVMIGPDVEVGDDCKIQNNVSLYKGVILGDEVFCGPSSVFTNVGNPRAAIERKNELRPTRIGRGATIGANATIVCGHDLGEYCFVAAGAVVTKNVSPFALVAGNPARQIGWISHDGERLGPDLVCPRSGRRYAIDHDGLIELAGVSKVT